MLKTRNLYRNKRSESNFSKNDFCTLISLTKSEKALLRLSDYKSGIFAIEQNNRPYGGKWKAIARTGGSPTILSPHKFGSQSRKVAHLWCRWTCAPIIWSGPEVIPQRSLRVSTSIFVFLSRDRSVCQFVRRSIFPCVYLPVHLSVHLPVCLWISISASVCRYVTMSSYLF